MDLKDGTTLKSTGRATLMIVVLAGCCLFSATLSAAKIVDLTMIHSQGTYQVKLEAILDAPDEDVRYVITDYVHIYRLNRSIIESEILPTSDDSTVRVKTRVNDCVFIFCRDILRVEDVRELETGELLAVVVPELSNIKSGDSTWRIRPAGDRTVLTYEMNLEPGFFVPPVIGTYLVKQKLGKETLASFDNIERIARTRSRRAQLLDRLTPPAVISKDDNEN